MADKESHRNSQISLSTDESSGSDENKLRGNWSGRMDFLLSCIGYAVGLGNVWRFPYLCYRNGGGAFLIPYFIFMVLCGMPLVFLEFSFGQFCSRSPISMWCISPVMKGLGYGMVIISAFCCVYYNVIITWTLYYLYLSVKQRVVPWSTCDGWWNTPNCVTDAGDVLGTDNMTSNATSTGNKITASQEFWVRYVLQMSDGIEHMDGVRLELLLCLALAWILVFFCLIKGIKSSGKVVYFTATFPYVLLTVLLIRGCMLPGSSQGILFYLRPEWSQLKKWKVWGEAATQIFYSMGPAWGGLITFASYNKFRNNCYRDAVIVPLMNSGTSVYAGLVVFSILGYMSHVTGVPIAKVASEGPGLAFVAYPEAVTTLPVTPLWAFLFFFMLLLIGLDSQFGMFETITSAIADEFPSYFKGKKMLLTICLCLIEFCMGIPCIMRGGMYVLQLMDWYSACFSLMLVCIFECTVISWIYGVDRFLLDIEFMIHIRPCLWWKILWKYVTPALITFILLSNIAMHKAITYGDYEYPSWAILIGWLMALTSIIPLPTVACITMFKTPGKNLLEKFLKALKPAPEWGPALEKYRIDYKRTLYDNGYVSYSHNVYTQQHILLPEKDAKNLPPVAEPLNNV